MEEDLLVECSDATIWHLVAAHGRAVRCAACTGQLVVFWLLDLLLLMLSSIIIIVFRLVSGRSIYRGLGFRDHLLFHPLSGLLGFRGHLWWWWHLLLLFHHLLPG